VSINNSLGSSNTTTTVTTDIATSDMVKKTMKMTMIYSKGEQQQISCMEEWEKIYFRAAWEIIFLWVNKEMVNCKEEQKTIYCMEDKGRTDYFDCGEGIDIIIIV
jgi:hypothetical protein